MGLIAASCALALGGCSPASQAPAEPSAGEASALADAEAMLEERPSEAPVAAEDAPETAAD